MTALRANPLPSGAADDKAVERRLQGSMLRVSAEHPFLAALLLMAPTVVTERFDTAATDGERLYFNPGFVAGLTAEQLDGLVVHEVLHCALLHGIRRKERDPLLWNIAADIHVNGIIRGLKHLDLPPGCVEAPALATLCVEEIYARLLRSKRVRPLLGMPDLVDAPGGRTQEDIERLGAFWADAMHRARAVAAMSPQHAGSLGADIDRLIDETHAPRLDWRTALWRHVVRTPDDYAGFDRRHMWQGLYLEQLEGEGLEVDVCIDTSGSVDDAQLTDFLSELRGILRAYPSVRCRLYYCDAACSGPFDVEAERPLPVAKGGGGTDFRPFFRASADPSAGLPFGGSPSASAGVDDRLAVYLTDGEGTFPESAPRRPVLWVVTPGGAADHRFPFGEVVRMRSNP